VSLLLPLRRHRSQIGLLLRRSVLNACTIFRDYLLQIAAICRVPSLLGLNLFTL
jgi:hypothetical protein